MNGAVEFLSNNCNKNALYEFKKTLRGRNQQRLIYFLFAICFASLGITFGVNNDSPIPSALWTYTALFTVLFGLIKSFQVAEESLLLVSPLGLQTTTVFCVGTKYTKYIPWCSIQDVIINEAVSGFRIVFYLAALVKDASGDVQLLPLLLNSKLRLPEIKEIYRDVQRTLKKQ